jgi:hypothetical protein
VDVEIAVERVEFIGQQGAQFELVHPLEQRVRILRDFLLGGLVLLLFEQLGQLRQVRAVLVGLFPRLDLKAQLLDLLQEVLRGFLVVPEVGSVGFLFEFRDFRAFAGEVKDSSGPGRYASGAR